jgi:site-specific recombinase XerD
MNTHTLLATYDEYLDYLRDNFSVRHCETVASRLRLFIFATVEFPDDYQTAPVDGVSFLDIRRFFRQLRKNGRSEATLASHRSTQVAFWNWCVNEGLRGDNPASQIKRSWSQRPVTRRAAPAKDVHLVLDSLEVYAAHRRYHPVDVRDALLVSFLGDNAGRLGAALDLRVNALRQSLARPVLLDDGVMYRVSGFGKTGSTSLAFFERTGRLADLHLENSALGDHVFCNLSTFVKLSNSGASKSFIRICNWVGVPVFRSHALRKRNVTDIIMMSGDWKVGQLFADHKEVSTTIKHYDDFEKEYVERQAHNLAASRSKQSQELNDMAKLFNLK